MGKIVDKLYGRLCDIYYYNSNYNVENTVLLSGTGRGGTTWLSNIINCNNEYRYIFEPFHNEKVPEASPFLYKQYLRPESKNEVLYKAAMTILSGKIKTQWTDFLNKKFYCNKRLIKDIRINLMLKWILVNFPKIPIILLLRHPCAIAYSKMKRKWDSNLNWFLRQDKLVDDFLYPFKNEMEQAKDDFEKHIFFWCVENYIPLCQISSGEVNVIFYENLCVNAVTELERLFGFLGQKMTEKVFSQLRVPSAMSRGDSAIVTGSNIVESWKNGITRDQTRRAIDILKLFRLDDIYTEDSLPHATSSTIFQRV